MQARDRLRHVGFIDHKADINLGRSLGDHLDIHIGNGAEDPRRNSGCVDNVLPHQANDGFSACILHIRDLGQIGGDTCIRWNPL